MTVTSAVRLALVGLGVTVGFALVWRAWSSTGPVAAPTPFITVAWDAPSDPVAFHRVAATSGEHVVEQDVAMPATTATLELAPGAWDIAVRACTSERLCSTPVVTRHVVRAPVR